MPLLSYHGCAPRQVSSLEGSMTGVGAGAIGVGGRAGAVGGSPLAPNSTPTPPPP
jgi:hypothetical protein